MSYGEFRSAMAEPDYVRAYQVIQSLENDEKSYALDLFWKTDLNILAEKAEWSNDRYKDKSLNSLSFINEQEWQLSIGGIVLASNKTLDLQPIQRKWSIIPARHVIPVWEAWAAKNAPDHLDAPRKTIEMIERGEFDRGIINKAWTYAAANAAAAAAANAAAAAAYAAAAYAAANAAANAAAAAAAAANAAAYTIDQNLVENITYDQWCFKFTAYILLIIRSHNV